jgi:hypothetical protein
MWRGLARNGDIEIERDQVPQPVGRVRSTVIFDLHRADFTVGHNHMILRKMFQDGGASIDFDHLATLASFKLNTIANRGGALEIERDAGMEANAA